MRRLSVLFVCTCFLFSLSSTFAAEAVNIPLGVQDYAHSQAHLTVTRNSPEFTTISLESPVIATQNVMADYQSYQSFGISGEYSVADEGSPTVPRISRFYRIPNTGSADLVITNAEYDVVDHINPFPVQPEEGGFHSLVRNTALYTRDGWYPANEAEMSDPMIMRDFRVVTVTLYPVQVNPVTHQARIYRNISVDVVANDHPGFNELLNPRRPTGSWAPIYREMITNLDDDALANMTTTPGSYMIVAKTNATILPFVDSLKVWKTRCGYKVIVDTMATWSAATMATHIRSQYANADPPLEFVALMGDPAATFGVPSDSPDDNSGNFDHTFALGNTNDDIEDIGCGRLSGSTQAEMSTINAKIMGYERTPYMADTTWFKKGFFYAGIANNIASNWTLMQWANQQFRANTGVVNNTIRAVNGHVDNTLVTQQFNGGISMFFWRGSWLSQMETTLANGFSNGWKLPICLCITCGANNFVSGLGIAESYLVAGTQTNPKGGVCSIGTATSGTHAPQNVTVAGGVVHAIADQQIEHIGHALNAGKIWLILSYGAGSTNQQNFTRWNNLMGEPGISMWTDKPVILDAAYPASLNVGAHNFHLVVRDSLSSAPISNALVVLWKQNGTADEVFVKGLTDSAGTIDLPISVSTAGDLLLTITKRNHKPLLATIACADADRMVAASTVTLDDDNSGGTHGNGDGQMNPGETIDLRVYLRNFGSTQTATGITATLTSQNPHVTVVQGNGTFIDLAPGDSALPSTNFRINVAPSMVRGEHGLLLLNVTASGSPNTSAIDLVCQAGRLDYISQTFSDTLNPGTTRDLTVTLRNNGTLAMTGVTAQLISLSPFVSVDDMQGTFGDIPVNQQASNSTDRFTVRANSQTYRGRIAPLRLIATTSDGVIDTVQFTVSVGRARTTDPTGPDGYGYYAYDNTDTASGLNPVYNYIDIAASGGTNLNLNDPGLQQDTTRYTAAQTLPFHFTFYGQTYDTLTICSNGWVAFGDQRWNTAFRNFPIPMMQAPEAMIAPYFDDLKTQGSGLGVWFMSDASNHRVVVQWKANGAANTTPLDFEVILYDSASHPTRSGNNMLDMQYRVVTLNFLSPSSGEADGESIGIQAPGDMVGLPYAFQNVHSPGAATVTANRAIRFTTEAHELFGQIAGIVTDAANSQPMNGATVSLDGTNYQVTTGADGHYLIQDVLVGTYNVRARYYRYNDGITANVIVELDSTEAVSMSLTHPVMSLSTNALQDSVEDSPGQVVFTISNTGNGPVDYATSIYFAGDNNPTPWDSVGSVNVTQLSGDDQVWGCEFMSDQWWVSGASGPNGTPVLYRFDLDGQFTGSIPQPSSTLSGWFDLATDGHYLYGSDSHVIYGIDASGQVQETIPSPLNPSRAIAYDPELNYLWVADYTSDIYVLDHQGNQIVRVPNPGIHITGLAWNAADPDTGKLYIFSRDGVNETRVSKYNPVTGRFRTVIDLPAHSGDHAAGCTVTPSWNSTLLVFAGLIRNNTGARLDIHELVFNSSWMHVSPGAGNVAGPGSQNVTVAFDPGILRSAVYHVNLRIASTIYDSTMVLPVTLTVRHIVAVGKPAYGVPLRYVLHQNYPNPFNPTTNIRYELMTEGMTRLSIYNVLGEKITDLVDARQPAGFHEVNFDASALPSGVYFYRLTSGNFTRSAKMVLMK